MTNLEQIAAISLAAGLVCLMIAAVWIYIAAWRVSWKWGLGLTLFAPAAVVFVPRNYARVKIPVALLVVATLLIGIPFAVNGMAGVSLKPRDKIVEQQRHITLTGSNQPDYAELKFQSDVVVLQMANADVTDEALQNLAGMTKLEELDLNDTQITDAGLAILKELPVLKILRLRGTKITNDGFTEHLAGKESLQMLDVRDTPVASKTMREWKKSKDGREYLK